MQSSLKQADGLMTKIPLETGETKRQTSKENPASHTRLGSKPSFFKPKVMLDRLEEGLDKPAFTVSSR